jgi:hypothetical protein
MIAMSSLGALLLIAGVGVVGGAVRRVLRAVGERRDSVVIGATLALLCVLPERVGRVTGSLRYGLFFVVVSAAVVLLVRRPRPSLEAGGPTWAPSARITAVVVGAALGFVSWTTWLWDESTTHLPLAGALARDVLPLQHPIWPGQPVRYHIGFAVLGALVRSTTQVPLDVALDIASTACLGALLWLLHDVGIAVAGPRAGALTIFVVLFADGPLAAFLADGWGVPGFGDVGRAFLPGPWINGSSFPPMVVTNFFQHPQGLAMPIALAAVLVASGGRTLARFAIAAVLLTCCAQAQVVFFAHTGLLLGVLVVAAARDERDLARTLARLGLLLVATAGAVALGGLLDPDAGTRIRVGTGFFGTISLRSVHAIAAHNLFAFGTTLLAPLVAVVVVARGGMRTARTDLVLALACAAALGFVVANVATYERSWDIVKFFGVAGFFGNLVLVTLLLHLRLPRVVIGTVVVVACWSALVWWVRYGPLNGVVATGSRGAGTGEHVEAFAACWSEVVAPTDRLWTASFEPGRAGFLVPGTDWRSSVDARALLLARDLVDADVQAWKKARTTMEAAALARLDVRFVALTLPEYAELPPAARAALNDKTRFTLLPAPKGCGAVAWRVWRVGRAVDDHPLTNGGEPPPKKPDLSTPPTTTATSPRP